MPRIDLWCKLLPAKYEMSTIKIPSNIFVVGTGRCGSVTFSKAAGYCTNYTVEHESHAGCIADLEYKAKHIEVSPQLIILIPQLRRKYPDALWVHLQRLDRDACAESLAKRSNMIAFADYWFLADASKDDLKVAYAIYDISISLIKDLLPPDHFWLSLESAKENWKNCWNFMKCEGDFEASLKEWDIKYNAGTP